MNRLLVTAALLSAALLMGCGSDTPAVEGDADAGSQVVPDSGQAEDAGSQTDLDSGTGEQPDASTSEPDAGEPDGSALEPDAGEPDGSTIEPDAGEPDAGAPDASVEEPDAGTPSGEVEVTDLGTVPLNTQGRSQTLTISAPAGAVSMILVIEGHSGVMYSVEELKNPAGTVLANTSLSSSSLNRLVPGEATPGFMVPITPDIAQHFVPGNYSLRFSGAKPVGLFGSQPDTRPVSVKAVFKMGPPATRGTIDVNIHCTTAGGITAATAPTDPRIVTMLADWRAIYGQVGIDIGQVRFFDMTPDLKVLESVQGANNDFGQACKAAAGAPGNALNAILVEEISVGGILGGFGTILGISGGIPGPAHFAGLERACLAINTTAPDGVTEQILGMLIAHEAGHYLGLYHSTENALGGLIGFQHDPISDTPEDDPNNIMFNNPLEGQNHYLSPMQGAVMRSNPLVY
ncbi:MAG: hypothetical protein ACOX6T_15225 [Myxococcales bacterium]|jgi:hypothetical protein